MQTTWFSTMCLHDVKASGVETCLNVSKSHCLNSTNIPNLTFNCIFSLFILYLKNVHNTEIPIHSEVRNIWWLLRIKSKWFICLSSSYKQPLLHFLTQRYCLPIQLKTHTHKRHFLKKLVIKMSLTCYSQIQKFRKTNPCLC